jgi:hypothetical protein
MSNYVFDTTSSSRFSLGTGARLQVKLTPMSSQDFQAKFPGADYMVKWVTEESAQKPLENQAAPQRGLQRLTPGNGNELYL